MRAVIAALFVCGCNSSGLDVGDAAQKPDKAPIFTDSLDLSVPGSCTDGLRNQDETDIDCGGSVCPRCGTGKNCAVDLDCVSNLCIAGTCREASCTDGRKDGLESDVDCGGGECPRCIVGLMCRIHDDCTTQLCKAMVCSIPKPQKLTFAQPVTYPLVDVPPSDVVIADLDGDKVVDVGVAVYNNGSVELLHGKGDGTLAGPAIFVAGGAGTVRLALGDFNGDARIDIAALNEGPNTVAVLLGVNNGLSAPSLVSLPGKIKRVLAVGDFDGDGRIDIVASDQLLLATNGGFLMPRMIDPPVDTGVLVAADFNRDGKTDLASQRGVFLSAHPGPGITFAQKWFNSDWPQDPRQWPLLPAMILTDLNGDGLEDIVYNLPSLMLAHLGNGKGGFGKAMTAATSMFTAALCSADFNGDGWTDVAVAAHDLKSVLVYTGRGDGRFDAAVSVADLKQAPVEMATGDLNGDGKPDIVVSVLPNAAAMVLLNTSHY